MRDGARQTSVLQPFGSMFMGLNKNVAPYFWSGITGLLLKSSGEHSHSLQAKCLKKVLDEFKVLFTPKKLIKRSGV